MKGRLTSTREKDPTLSPGFAYMVTNDGYLEHLAKYVDQDEITNNKRAKGLHALGIGLVSCSRHELFHANGTGDLQKGEKYANMDYLWFSSVMGIVLLSIIASYDITCQWFCNFWERMKALPDEMHLPESVKVQFKVPKFHLPPHIKKCHAPFSFNFTKWVGRTDGEGVERNWSWLNMIARSVSVMGPGSWEDTIDDFCGYANWRENGINGGNSRVSGNSLLRKMVLAILKAMLHDRAFHTFTDAPTMEEVWLQIAEEEHARAEKGDSRTNKPASFILAGLAIEEEQQKVHLEAKRRGRTSTQAADLQRKRTLLLGMVKCLRNEQAHFMPGLAALLGTEPPVESSRRPEEMQLHLPSSFAKEVRERICMADLPAEEERLRVAQAHEALHDLRRHLHIRTLAHQFKRRHTAGQGAYTKSQALQSGIEERIKGAAAWYGTAREALVQLRGLGDWEAVLQVLQKKDIRGMNKRTLNDEEKEEERKARIQAGLPPDEEEVDEFGDVVEPTVLFNLEMGEAHRHFAKFLGNP
ncbi:hypothetical protein B0H14DRAFT_3092779 [Mycena olivaceomarginata]|nr:hypothetical protein B0H14DRAFT_3092779 [Mycena olivaceomarginata]